MLALNAVFKSPGLWIAMIVALVVVYVVMNAAVFAKAGESRGPSETVHLMLPPVIYAVPGVEANVYFDNVTLVVNPVNYVFDVTCDKGLQQVERWTCVPSADDVGDWPLVIEVRDQSNALIDRAESTLRVVSRDAGAGAELTLLCIGDSLTNAGGYTRHLLSLMNGGEQDPNLRLIGSHYRENEKNSNRHEGYGGWTAQRFATHYTGIARTGDTKERGSPFLYKTGDAEPVLDFARYCQELNDGRFPDYVTIFLGCNDIFRATDETIDASIDTMFAHYDTLLDMIANVDATIKIGLVLPVPPAGTQDAFGANYANSQTRWQYKRNEHRLVERMMQKYVGRQDKAIDLIPAYVNIDCMHNYPAVTVPVNGRSTQTRTRLANGCHPAGAGYLQIGDSIYSWMKSTLRTGQNEATEAQ